MTDIDKTEFFNNEDASRTQREFTKSFISDQSKKDVEVTQVIDNVHINNSDYDITNDASQISESEVTQVINTKSHEQKHPQSQWEYNNLNMTMQINPISIQNQSRVTNEQANFFSNKQYAKSKVLLNFIKYFFFTILICAGIAAATVFVTYELNLWGGVFVPDVNGKTIKQAIILLEDAGFEVEFCSVKSDDNVDIVFSSNPEQGKKAPPKSKVFIHYYVQRTIPSVVGLDLETAKRKLNEDGYTDICVNEVTSNEASGSVLEVSPAEGSAAMASMRVRLTVAKNIKMPDVVGKSEQDAIRLLGSLGIKVRIEYEPNTTKPNGIVVSSNPVAGKTVNTGYFVTLVVSRMLQNIPNDYATNRASDKK